MKGLLGPGSGCESVRKQKWYCGSVGNWFVFFLSMYFGRSFTIFSYKIISIVGNILKRIKVIRPMINCKTSGSSVLNQNESAKN